MGQSASSRIEGGSASSGNASNIAPRSGSLSIPSTSSTNHPPHPGDRSRTSNAGVSTAASALNSRSKPPVGSRLSWPPAAGGHTDASSSAASGPSRHSHRSSQRDFQFNSIHGKNITLTSDRKTATRNSSFCNAIVFTNRPMRISELFHVELIQYTQGWSGVLRFGFTNTNPAHMDSGNLPKYACPDLTVKPGNWAKALRESYAKHTNVLNFFVNEEGEVYYSINQTPFAVFFTGVDTSKPLWGLIDVYGNTTGVKIRDNYHTSRAVSPRGSLHFRCNDNLRLMAELQDARSRHRETSENAAQSSQLVFPQLEPLPFHKVHGKNVELNETWTIAERKPEAVYGGGVFISRCLRVNEEIYIKAVKLNQAYVSHMGVGVTTCNPTSLEETILPDDAEDLLDRPEYWVMTREFDEPGVGEIIGFMVDAEGRLHKLSRHGTSKNVLMHVDTSTPLWMFFDIYGTTQTIKILGTRQHKPRASSFHEPSSSGSMSRSRSATTSCDPRHPTCPLSTSETFEDAATLASKTAAANSSNMKTSKKVKPERPPPPRSMRPQPSKDKEITECAVCFEGAVNAVFYKCGHVCCCVGCGQKLKMRGDPCPICRAPIDDVIRFYRP